MLLLFTVSWQEVLDIADNLRPYTSEAMKIEVAPWIRDYVVDLEELYTQLTLEKIHNKIAGECTKTLKDYREVFDEILMTYKDTAEQKNDSVPDDFGRLYDVAVESVHEGMVDESDDFAPYGFVIDDTEKSVEPQKGKKVLMKGDLDDFTPDDFVIDDTEKSVEPQKGKKVLMKGDPGMGKTSLCKKIAWDWARRLFTAVSVTFLVLLKLVKPDDAIKNVIINQNPYIEGLNISKEKLQSILETFGNRCLLILDGLDEHALGANQDVLKIIRGQKLLNCNIMVTSRLHSSRQIERYFPAIVRVEGFTRDKAEQFASKILTDQQKIDAVLRFNPTNFREDVPIYKCPILLSFVFISERR